MKLTGVIHLPPLPGSPRALSMDACVARAIEDARALADAGFDVAMIENFGDAPFFAIKVPPITIAAMTACALAVRGACPTLSIGINVLRNDAAAALAIAHAAGAECIRVNVHTGARVTDQGVIEGDAASTLRARAELGSRVKIWADVDVKHSAPLAPRPIEDETKDLVERGLADAVLVTGRGTGSAVDLADLDAVRRASKVPVFVASGARLEDIAKLRDRCDGVVVGSALRKDGRAGGPMDRDLAKSFVDLAQRRS